MPTPNGDISEAGDANGPAINPNDCKTSDRLSPKMRRRKGDVNPPSDLTIAVAMVKEEIKEIDALKICAYAAAPSYALPILSIGDWRVV